MITSDKDASIYGHFLSVIERNTKRWRPAGLIADFEEVEWFGVNSVFLECVVLGCWFHLKQAIERWLKSNYEKN